MIDKTRGLLTQWHPYSDQQITWSDLIKQFVLTAANLCCSLHGRCMCHQLMSHVLSRQWQHKTSLHQSWVNRRRVPSENPPDWSLMVKQYLIYRRDAGNVGSGLQWVDGPVVTLQRPKHLKSIKILQWDWQYQYRCIMFLRNTKYNKQHLFSCSSQTVK